MKALTLTTAVILLNSLASFSQGGKNPEFESNSKAHLIYSDETMGQLHYIVDSLNLKFRSCSLDRDYKSKVQTHGFHFTLKENLSHAEQDLKNGIDVVDFKSKYPDAFISSKRLIAGYEYTDYNNIEKISFYAYPGEQRIVVNKQESTYKTINNRLLIYERNSKIIRGFFLVNEPTSSILPEKYARMVQYADCMIDTNGIIHTDDPTVKERTELPRNYKKMSLEKKREVLSELRNTHVMGMCSMDESPRVHAKNIAVMSAEALEWEIFLRAHLNIMNDRFDRMSDGSYAEGRRGTYIRELEALEINVLDLLLGTSIQISNASKGHYFASIPRVGRAIAESSKFESIQENLSAIMADNSLDDLNRIIAFYLWQNAIQFMPENQQKTETSTLKEASNGLPKYFREAVLLK